MAFPGVAIRMWQLMITLLKFVLPTLKAWQSAMLLFTNLSVTVKYIEPQDLCTSYNKII